MRIISDRNSRRSKGIAYVEFTDRSAVPLVRFSKAINITKASHTVVVTGFEWLDSNLDHKLAMECVLSFPWL